MNSELNMLLGYTVLGVFDWVLPTFTSRAALGS